MISKNSSLLFFISLLFLTSCIIQKRNYTKGYFVQWKNSCINTKENTLQTYRNAKKKNKPETVLLPSPSETLQNKNVSLNVSASILQIKKPNPVFTGTKTFIDNCDTIVFRDSIKIKAKVIEITQDQIKYKKCNNPDGPIFSVSKSKIAYVKYTNGQQEDFTAEKVANGLSYIQQQELLQELIGKKATTTVVFSILSFFLLYFGIALAFFTIIKAKKTLSLIKKNPPANPQFVRRAKIGLVIALIAFSLILILDVATIIAFTVV